MQRVRHVPPIDLRVALPLALAALVGCQSGGLTPRNLPAQYVAQPGAGFQQIRMQSLSSVGAASDTLGVDDVLGVTVVTGLETEAPEPLTLRVNENGQIEPPLIGPVAIAGLDPTRAAARIASEAMTRGVYRQPQVQIEVLQQATHRVTVLGAVETPGVHEVPRHSCDIVTAIAAAGGFTEEAGAVVEVLRHGSPVLADASPPEGDIQQVSFDAPALAPSAPAKRTDRFDLTDLVGQPPTQQRLDDRDVVVVRQREKRVVHVSGLVQTPNQFELTDDHDLRVLDAIAMAGGATTVVADKVIVIRNVPSAPQPVVISVSMNRAKKDGGENLVLQSGDMVSVEPTLATNVADAFNTLFRVTMGVGGDLTLF
ncbi:MAG: SLBB domain-containing protein [Planctomycetota bacterium]